MQLRQLKYFVTVIEAKSVTRAAELLHVAQPAVSQQIHKLEATVGERLLLRHSRGIEPTEAGARLLSHAMAILGQVDVAKQDLREMHGPPSGKVRLGMPWSVTDMIGVPLFKDCRRTLPDVSLCIIQRLSETLNELLASGGLDLTFSYNPETITAVDYELLLGERLCLVGSRKTPEARRRRTSINFATVTTKPLILPSAPHVIRMMVEAAAASRAQPLNVAYEVDSVDMIRCMVEEGLGYTVSSAVMKNAVDDGLLWATRIVDPHVTRRLYLARSTRQPLSRAKMGVRDLIHQRIRDFAAGNLRRGVWELELPEQAELRAAE